MTRKVDPLWRLLAERPRTAGSLKDWREWLGEAFDLVQPLLRPTGHYARTWTCGELGRVGCHRQVHDHGDQVVAVCGEQPRECDRVTLARQDLVLYRVDARQLGRALLNGVVGFETDHQPMQCGWFLGTVRFGQELIGLHLGLASDAGSLLAVRRDLGERWPDRRMVLLVPRAELVGAPARVALTAMDSVVIPLDEAMVSDSSLRADLADVVTTFRFADADLGSLLTHRYDLVLDPAGNRFWLYGEPIAFKARARYPQRLLAALAEKPGALVTRLELYGAVWPDEYGAKGSTKDYYRALRDQVTALKKVLDLDDARYPIVAHPSGDDADGGYSLRLDPRRVYWWSESIE